MPEISQSDKYFSMGPVYIKWGLVVILIPKEVCKQRYVLLMSFIVVQLFLVPRAIGQNR